MENNSEEEETFVYYEQIEKNPRIQVLHWKKEFNYSAVNNMGEKEAKGEDNGVFTQMCSHRCVHTDVFTQGPGNRHSHHPS